MILVVATRNPYKLKEIQCLCQKAGLRIKSLKDFPRLPSVVEDGTTLKANAIKKAVAISRILHLPALADDSGLFVPALGNQQPGVHSARYAGPACNYYQNNRKLLKLMKTLPPANRQAYFATWMALAIPGKAVITRSGKVWGWIELRPRGQQGFGYDPVFRPQGYDKTYAEMSPEEKNRISHRAIALAKIAQVICKLL